MLNMNKKIFISYSHQNMEWAQENGYNLLPWLESQLAPEGISVWWDKDLKRMPGIEYEQRIYSKIDEADLAILLISQEYAASSFIRCKEEPHIKARYERGELMILPLMISPVSNMYKNNRLSWIFDLQIFPEATKPLIDIVKDKSRWESTKVNLLDGIYNRITSSAKPSKTVKPDPTPIPAPIPQPTPDRIKKYWWVMLCAVVIGVFGWVWSNREPVDYPDIEENIPLEIITEEINSEDSNANAELEELRATQALLEKENNELKHNNEELKNSNKDLQKDIDNIKAKEEAERQAKLQAERKAKEEAEKSAKLQTEKKAKEEANREAQQATQVSKIEAYGIGNDYYYGRNGKLQDYAEAVKWYRKSAEQGYAYAQDNLGVCYENGQGVKQDYAEAVKWYRKAAEQGDADAQNNLGVCYRNGQGVEKDINKAIELYQQAARQGHEIAQKNLKELGKSW